MYLRVHICHEETPVFSEWLGYKIAYYYSIVYSLVLTAIAPMLCASMNVSKIIH